MNITNGLVVQLVRTPPCHGGGHGFESRSGRLFYALNESEGKVNRGLSSAGRAPALQAGGHRFEPCRPQLFSNDDELADVAQLAEQLICNQQVIGSSPIIGLYGWVPERPKGADCKSVVSDFGGSNPPPSTQSSEGFYSSIWRL